MSATADDFAGQAAELRAAFDRAFSSPRRATPGAVVDLLALRVGDATYAVRLPDLTGVVSGRDLLPVPSTAPGLLGIAGIGGDIVPVFSLAVLLGAGSDPEAPRWTALCGRPKPIGFGFRALDAFIRLPIGAVLADTRPDTSPGPVPGLALRYVDALATTEKGALPVIALPRILSDIMDRRATRRHEEVK